MDSKGRVFLIENSKRAMNVNRRALEKEGFRVATATSLDEARERLPAFMPEVIVLDSVLKDGSGYDFCKEAKPHMVATFLFFAKAGSDTEIMEAFQAGANDYIPTPYPKEEFVAWITAHINLIRMVRKQANRVRYITRDTLSLDLMTATATIDEKDLYLGYKEFAVLLHLIQNEGEFLSNEYLIEHVWKRKPDDNVGTLKTVIYRLRKKFEGTKYNIIMKRRIGYCFLMK